ncbi:MAG TPA: MDR family MFS transporter [Chloroflexota bacterium]|nr:MDR family MFS transporter [Chloroflexota bacterium]
MPLRRIGYKWLVAVAFVAGMFMDLMDTTVVNVALPTLSREFGAGTGAIEWVVTGYLLSLAVWVPASGWIGDRFGTKRTFLVALAVFTTCSALCGAAWSVESLIAFRLLQGVGGGMLTPVGTAMLFRAFPARERAQAAAVLSVPTAVAPALGPVLGGWLVDTSGWRWIFLVNVPIGLAAFLFSLRFLREHTEPAAGRFDVGGFLCSGGGLALVLYALSRGPTAGWASAPVLVSGAAGVALFAVLVAVELGRPDPLLHLRLFRDRLFRSGMLVMFMASAALLGVLFLLPLFLQQLLGLSALDSGLTTFPQAVGMVLMTQVTSRLYPRVGPRRMLAVALAGLTTTSALFLLVGLHTDLWWIRGIMLLRGVSMSFALVAAQAATFATIDSAETGRASSLFSTNRQVAGSVGVAMLATVLTERTAAHLAGAPAAAALLGFHDAFAAAMVFGLLGFCFALGIRDQDAAASMPPARAAHRAPASIRREPRSVGERPRGIGRPPEPPTVGRTPEAAPRASR